MWVAAAAPKHRGFGALPCPQQVVFVGLLTWAHPWLGLLRAVVCPGVPGEPSLGGSAVPSLPQRPGAGAAAPKPPQRVHSSFFLPLLRSRTVNFMHLGHCLAAPALEARLKWSLDLVVALEMISLEMIKLRH